MNSLSASELADLISRARSGCSDSLGELLEQYQNYLRLIAAIQLNDHLRAKVSPSDMIQATFLQAHRAFANFAGNSEGQLVTWLRRILASQLATEVRRYSTQRRDITMERRMNSQVDNSSVLLGGMLAGKGKSPSESAMRREDAVLLADALARLPANYRKIIVMRHLKGHGFGEISEQMNRSVDSVKSIWRRAIGRLRESLDEARI